MVQLTIDDKKIEVPEGTTVLRAAQSAGIDIPTLCDHPNLTPYGGCRLCLVEVEGARTLQPSCTMPASPNMVVKTNTEKVKSARKFVLTMIFSERNHLCPYCVVSGGDCELQNAAYHEDMTHWPLSPNWQSFDVDASHPYIVVDNNRCILCRRCVRACGELVGNYTLGFEERGARSYLVADFGTPLGESTCVSCGMCVQVCPTGTLIDRWSAYRGKETQVDHHETICTGCSVGCGIDVMTRNNALVRIEGNWSAAVNGGVVCKVGRFDPFDNSGERILTPLINKDGKLKAATWQEALDVIASQLKSSSPIVAAASTRLSAEALYQFKNLFAGNLKSACVTSLEEGAFTAAAAETARQNKIAFEGKLDVLKKSDCIVLVGTDLVNNHEVDGFFVKRILSSGTHLIVVDAAGNALDNLADFSFKAKESDTLKVLSEALSSASEDGSALSEAAKLLAAAKQPTLIYSKANPALLKSIMDFARTAGILKEGYSGIIGTKGLANSVAASQYQLDSAFKAEGAKAAFIALGDEGPSQKLIQALSTVPFLVVQASYTSQLTAMAEVVLPAATWMEQEGHYVNSDGRIQKAVKVLDATEEIRTNEAIIKALAEKLGFSGQADDWKNELTTAVASVVISE
ncbi:MAG: molybdopterin-dependent oxidoreductase [Anaerolineae bacterium]|nr:molybdopterin-dependent oxidoreductase [Anaerolineae bacterium]